MGRRANGEGAVFTAHGSGWATKVWVAAPDGSRRRVSLSAPTKAALVRKVADARAAGEAGQPARLSRVRLGDYVETWIATSLAARDVSPGTRRLYALTLRSHVVPALGGVRLDQLRPAHVEALHARIKTKATRRSAHTVLRLLCATAVRDGLLRANPVAAVPRPADPPKRQPHYTLAQAQRLIGAAQGLRTLAQLVPLLLFTGMRVGEALALRWADVDFAAGRLEVAGTLAVDEAGKVFRSDYLKDGKPVKVLPLLPQATAALGAARAAQAEERLAAGPAWVDLGLVFADQLGGLLDDRTLRKPYRAVVSGCGLAGSFHALRRSTASVLTAAGVPLPVISEILGHSSGRVTQAHYVVVDEAMMRAALQAGFGGQS